MRLVDQEIAKAADKKRKFLSVTFNAWKYNSQEQIWAALLQEMANAFEKNLSLFKIYKYRILRSLKGDDRLALVWNIFIVCLIFGVAKLSNFIATKIDGNLFEVLKWVSPALPAVLLRII
jgi:hypothetical protein